MTLMSRQDDVFEQGFLERAQLNLDRTEQDLIATSELLSAFAELGGVVR